MAKQVSVELHIQLRDFLKTVHGNT